MSYNFVHYYETLDRSTQHFCGCTRSDAVSLVQKLGLRTEGTIVGFAARKDTRREVTPHCDVVDWIIYDGTKGYTMNTKSAARFTVKQLSEEPHAPSTSPVPLEVRVLAKEGGWRDEALGILESKEATTARDGDNREVMLQEWITKMSSADYRSSLPKASGLKIKLRLAKFHSKQYFDRIQRCVEQLEEQLGEEAAVRGNSPSQVSEQERSSSGTPTGHAGDTGSPGSSRRQVRFCEYGLPHLLEDWEEPPPSYDAAMSK